MTSHLNDLKGQVVIPLLRHVQNISVENISHIINSELYKDLVTNHYPRLRYKFAKFDELFT